MPFPLIILLLYSIIMHCSCSRFKMGVAELKRRGYTCHMAECILISSDTEKTSSDEELPSFSSILKRKTTRPSSSKNKGAVRDSTATRNKNNKRSTEFSSTSNVIELDSPPDVAKCAEPESQSVSEEEELELDPKVAKKRRIEKEKEARRLERERKKAEKEHEKRVHKMVSQAETEGRKETRPGHRVKQMIVQLETSITECPKLMKSLLEQLEELEVQYKVEPSLPQHCVMWKRKSTTRCLDQELAKVSERERESKPISYYSNLIHTL
ncbi:PREDICTED: uncharacterized protein LOC100634841 isoform X1 [Amphimedon queenslandica]|uniref:Uncharacterized protein n=1 Tax=Amphimedon queenslandica TaxID=400682 RepID=A0AAN0J8D5_AMPQE|nr:PREDICTED: uncharacterized protein LOC100634841 isoform X1 [Amphimedon queenslandica]|eukprot:XP_019852996.1 PREDICTED: uncharacterized protein LOC100634841 isoform X1 [Amphimedon queenslandica]